MNFCLVMGLKNNIYSSNYCLFKSGSFTLACWINLSWGRDGVPVVVFLYLSFMGVPNSTAGWLPMWCCSLRLAIFYNSVVESLSVILEFDAHNLLLVGLYMYVTKEKGNIYFLCKCYQRTVVCVFLPTK